MKDSQRARLLTRLNSGGVLHSRSEVARWLGRRAGQVIQEMEGAGVVVAIKVGRKTYIAAVWRWKP